MVSNVNTNRRNGLNGAVEGLKDFSAVRSIVAGYVLGIGLWLDRAWYWLPATDLLIWPFLVYFLVSAFRKKSLPPTWLILITFSVGVTLLWTANPIATGFTTIRALGLGLFGIWTLRGFNLYAFAAGLSMALAIQTAWLASELGEGRTYGLSRHVSLLGATGVAAFGAVPFRFYAGGMRGWFISAAMLATATLMIAGAGARASIFAVAAHAGIRVLRLLPGTERSIKSVPYLSERIFLTVLPASIVIGVTVINVVASGDANRLTPANVTHAIADRAQTNGFDRDPGDELHNEAISSAMIDRGVEEVAVPIIGSVDLPDPTQEEIPADLPGFVFRWTDWFGVGVNAYLKAHPWPRPHSLLILAYEMGFLVLIPLGVAAWALRRKYLDLATVALIVVHGAADDQLVSVDGMYALAVLLIVAAGVRKQVRY